MIDDQNGGGAGMVSDGVEDDRQDMVTVARLFRLSCPLQVITSWSIKQLVFR